MSAGSCGTYLGPADVCDGFPITERHGLSSVRDVLQPELQNVSSLQQLLSRVNVQHGGGQHGGPRHQVVLAAFLSHLIQRHLGATQSKSSLCNTKGFIYHTELQRFD